MSLENTLFSNKQIRQFMENMRQKDIDKAIRDLCLLGINLFKDRNPKLPHYSLQDIQRCLDNFIEESKLNFHNHTLTI